MSAVEIAKNLLDAQAVQVNAAQPFTWSSGLRTPIYCDNRRLLSFPDVRNRVAAAFADLTHATWPSAEAIAGVATAGIPIGVLAADRLNLPFGYVRGAAKGHGLGNRIEGALPPGCKVVVVEDLISTGGSCLQAALALREAGYEVLGVMCVFSYRLAAADAAFAEAGLTYTALTDLNALVQLLRETNPEGIAELERWRLSPEDWRPSA